MKRRRYRRSRQEGPFRITSWSPLVPGGINFRTRRLVRRGDVVVMRASITLLVLGTGGLALGAAGALLVANNFVRALGVLLMVGAAFCLRPRIVEVDGAARVVRLKDRSIAFDEVGALQILGEWLKSRATDFTSYELNLVLKDGSRVNLMDHGNHKHLHRDGALLAEMIGCELHDGVVDERFRR